MEMINVMESSRSAKIAQTIALDKLTRGMQKLVNSGKIATIYRTKKGNIVARTNAGRVLTDIISGEKRKRTIDEIIYAVQTGAYTKMGRDNVGTAPADGTRVYDSRVPLVDGCYDKGGVYWGSGHIRVKYTKDLSYIEFYRVGDIPTNNLPNTAKRDFEAAQRKYKPAN